MIKNTWRRNGQCGKGCAIVVYDFEVARGAVRAPTSVEGKTMKAGDTSALTMRDKHAAHQYILGADDSEHARLLAQCEIHRPEAEWLFERLEISLGQRVLDVGCGPLGVLDVLSARVGPSGEVVGLDNEPRMIEFAERSIAQRGLSNVTLVRADAASTGLPDDYFDLAHERLLLVNMPVPQAVVAEMIRVVRPGGWIAVENADFTGWSCEPRTPRGRCCMTRSSLHGRPPDWTRSSVGACPRCCVMLG
jgi:SAM-dependent methyltransferase